MARKDKVVCIPGEETDREFVKKLLYGGERGKRREYEIVHSFVDAEVERRYDEFVKDMRRVHSVLLDIFARIDGEENDENFAKLADCLKGMDPPVEDAKENDVESGEIPASSSHRMLKVKSPSPKVPKDIVLGSNTGSYSGINQKLDNLERRILSAGRKLENVEREEEILKRCLYERVEDTVLNPEEEDLQQTLTVHELKDDTYRLAFTRCQRRSVTKAKRKLEKKYPNAIEVFARMYSPNGVSTVNCLKERLMEKGIKVSRKNNVMTFQDENDMKKALEILQHLVDVENREKIDDELRTIV